MAANLIMPIFFQRSRGQCMVLSLTFVAVRASGCRRYRFEGVATALSAWHLLRRGQAGADPVEGDHKGPIPTSSTLPPIQ
jgi:hypothetical protein